MIDKKIMVCAPQHSSKMYAWNDYYDAISRFTHPNVQIYLSDNSEDETNANFIRLSNIDCGWNKPKEGESVFDRIVNSHKDCREKFLKSDCDYMLHLETDVIPPIDVIERLLCHEKHVVSAMYEVGNGSSRKLMIQPIEPVHRNVRDFRCVDYADVEEPLILNGFLQRVFASGLGCTLIRRDVLSSIDFRIEQNNFGASADTYWANDLFVNNIPMYVDTSVFCRHLNQSWGDRLSEF